MSVDLYEKVNSRAFDQSRKDGKVTFQYVAVGSSDEQEIYDAVVLATPATYGGLVRQSIGSPDLIGPGVANVSVVYGVPDGDTAAGEDPAATPDTPDDATELTANYSFSTGGGTAHILQSKYTEHSYAATGAGPVPDTKRAIGVTLDGVEGCDILVPSGEWSLTLDRPRVTLPYLRTLLAMTGTVNSLAWRGFAARSLLFIGAEGQGQVVGNRTTITYKFKYSENIPAGDERAVIHDGLTLTDGKKGHEYVWCLYPQTVDPTSGRMFPRATHAFIERVYDARDFSLLGIGG